MSNANREVVATWFEQVWNAGDETAIDRLMAPGATFHGLTPNAAPVVGPAAYKPFVQAYRQAFPDVQIRILRMVCEGDQVACHCMVTGTHTGPGIGVQASGSPMKMEGMAIATIRDGQVQEAWNCFDFMSLYQQVGMLPALPAA